VKKKQEILITEIFKDERINMRAKQRVPIILDIFKSRKVKEKFLNFLFKPDSAIQLDLFKKQLFQLIDDMVKKWKEKEDDIAAYWKKSPHLRLTQVLTNKNIIPHTPGMWFYTEETYFLIANSLIEPRDILFWGQNYDENGKLLPKTKYILIKDMEISHIEAILKGYESHKLRVDEYYLEVFRNELKLRKNGKVHY